MNTKIIPYPGLRPFTEEEAIFFKGRDQHIRQIITQLQERKIVIVTGASGDGKSSLIYAGVIPNARAGFFKAKFNNWIIADFRPERQPLRNLSNVLSQGLDMDTDDVYEELQFGFASLVNIYKQSKYYIDVDSNAWKNATEQERKEMRSNAANLMIISDQFEEFFTNPENFAGGRPSLEAYTTVNLLLETARISIRNNLPIYIIFTMRSDFISDCVAFKGLPEFIGYSQFFVPRLKRNELKQVIEEPAHLAGGKVSSRLTEVLINELHEGHDQLPVLQHTLNRLWRIADYGKQDLDLIHLAKIGGLNPELLDDKDKQDFNQWFERISEKQKVYFENPSLNNVLNFHANTLYDNAFEYFQNNVPWAENNLTEQKTYKIIKISFLGLTRIDDGRAVRNRMSLQELKNLIDEEKITIEHVNGVINIFREPDSTFIRPFINPDDIDTQYLAPNTVLDITHEALIRNWELLKEWEKEEEENFNDFQEFYVQLRRWIDSGKKKEYLLALGPLSYFEAWYERCRPNKYWLAKNDRTETDVKRKLRKAEQLENDIKEFLKTSRAFIEAQEKRKRRLRRIIGIVALIAIFVLIILTTWALRERKNAVSQRQLAEKQKEIAEKQRNEAIKANKLAEIQRKRAEIEALKALKEKKKADSLLQVALELNKIAEEQRLLAEEQAARAIAEKMKADSLRLIAEEQKQIAIEASNKAQRLSILSLAQSLAYKATTNYKDVQINLLLAYYAYYFNKKYDGDPYSPEIFKGLFSAFQRLDEVKNVWEEHEVFAFYSKNEDQVYFLKENGNVYEINLKTGKKIKLSGYFKKTTIQKVWWDEMEDFFIKEGDDNLWWFNLSKKEKYFIKRQAYSTVYSTLTINGEILLFNTNGLLEYYTLSSKQKIKKEEEFKLKNLKYLIGGDKLHLVVSNITKDIFYIISRNGVILSFNTLLKSDSLVLKLDISNDDIISSMNVSDDSHYLVIGTVMGNVYLIDLWKKILVKEIPVANSNIRDVLLDPDSKRLIVVNPDNYLNLYRLDNLETRPISFSPIGDPIKQIKDVGHKIIGISNNKIFWLFPDLQDYAEIIFKYIKRNFTEQEWQMFMQDLIPKIDIIKQQENE